MKRFLIPFLLLFAVGSTIRAQVNCPAPTGLATTQITTNSAFLSWSAVAGASGYELLYKKDGTIDWISVSIVGNPGTPVPTSHMLQGLMPDTWYVWKVRAICSNTAGSDFSDTKEFKTLGSATVCSPPTGLQAFNITQTSALLKWVAGAGAIGYEVQWTVCGTNAWQTATTTANKLELINLQPNTCYLWHVRSLCENGVVSDWSANEDFHTLAGSTCGHPSSLLTVNITQNSAVLKWGAVSGALHYEVNWKKCDSGDWQSATVNTNLFQLGNLMPATCYLWRVRTICDGNVVSDWSDQVEFHTLGATTCAKPEGLETGNITQNSANLSWIASAGALGYEVSWKKCDQTTWNTAFTTATSYFLGNLSPATCYHWRVRAKCDGGIFSDYSVQKEFVTLGQAGCPKPVDLVTYAITQTSAKMKWNAVSGAVGGYEIQWKKCDALDWNSATVATNQFQVDNLMPGTCYVWRVRAICDPAGGGSDWSVVVEFHTLGGTATCVAPHDLTEHDITHHSVILKWSAVGGAIGYEVRFRKIGSTDWSTISVGPINKLFVDNLMAESDYEWQVRTICISNAAGTALYSDWSDSSFFSTLPEPPPPAPCDTPENLDVDSISHHAAKFFWDDVNNAFSYELRIRQVGTTAWIVIQVNGNPLPNFKWVDGLKPDTEYEAQIRAKCGPNNWSDWSDLIEFQTAETPVCDAVTDLEAIDITHYSAKLTWSAVNGAVSYRVRYRKVGTAVWKIKIINGNPPATEVVASPLAPNSLQEWQVKAFCGPGSEGPWSSLDTFMTLPAPPCDVPTGLAVVVNGPTSATFSWNATGSATSYKLRYRKINPAGNAGGWKIKTITGNPPATTTTINNLTQNSNYEAQVKAFCGPGSESPWSASINFTTPPQLIGDGPDGLFGNKNWLGNLSVWPNPASEQMTFQFESTVETGAELRVFDLAGRTVFTTQLAVNEGVNAYVLPVGQLVGGLYVAQLRGTELVLTTKIRVER